MIQQPQLRYFLYARKSSESEDRQMASINDQINEVKKIAKELGIEIVAIYSESKSAKAPGRKIFNEMLLQIEKGKANGILCWKLNRLARNPVDGGKISWMLQQNIIQHIQCYGRDYKPSDNVLMMQVELGMANQFVKDLSVDVKRGARAKAERGWNPSARLPIGYLHNKDGKRKVLPIEINIDKKRYGIIKKLWKLMLTGDYSIREIKKIGDNLGLMSERKNPHALNTYYKIFTNDFYYGYFFWKNSEGIVTKYKGKHKPMISEEEFEYVQIILGNRKRITRPKKYNHAYTGLMKCGECQSSITAENKHQVRCTNCRYKFSCLHRDDCPKCTTKITSMKNPTTIKIIYYRCTKRKKKCSQKFITQKKLEKQIISTLKSIEIPKNFYDFMYDELKKLHKQMDTSDSDIINSLKKQLSELNNRKKSLALMRADDEISSEEFIKYKKETIEKIAIIEKEMKIDAYKETNWLVIAKDYLNIAINASSIINGKDNFTKKRLLSKLGSNQILIDKKLYILKAKPLLAIKNCYDLYHDEIKRFEPEKNLVKQGLSQGLYTLNSSWCTELHQVRTSIIQLNNNEQQSLVA